MSNYGWYLCLKIEYIEGTTGKSAHFQFLPTSYTPKAIEEDGYQVLAGFNQEPMEKSFTVTLRDPRPKCPINWAMVPEVYRYVAMSREGDWYLFRNCPKLLSKNWENVGYGSYDKIGIKTDGIHWRDSLYQRPDQ